jgi:LDH2 family malate/lactate/ureidoglycolate dehydrogenase
MPPTMQAIPPNDLIRIVTAVFVRAGLPGADAAVCAKALVDADLRGVRSHGTMRVGDYVRWIQAGQINPRPGMQVVVDSGTTAVVDGDGAMGYVSADLAMRLAISRAREHGIGAVGLRNGRHSGAMAYWAMLALEHGCIGFATTNAGMNMAPWGGKDKIVGNNPFAIAVPSRTAYPMVLDMATSVAAGGKLDMAVLRGESIPIGWALDSDGNPTTDPMEARKGSLLPVGGPKGYAMAVMLDVVAGVLTGGRFGAGLGGPGCGQFYLALEVERFMPLAEFLDRIDQLVDQIHASALGPGSARIFVPGEIEHEKAERSQREGFPIEATLLAELESLAGQR